MPYSIVQAVTVEPFGLTVPFRVAVVCATNEAVPVTTVGALGSCSTPSATTSVTPVAE